MASMMMFKKTWLDFKDSKVRYYPSRVGSNLADSIPPADLEAWSQHSDCINYWLQDVAIDFQTENLLSKQYQHGSTI